MSFRLVVVGGNGFIGSAVCRAALSKGFEVTSISSSGRPYQTPKGHSPGWVKNVNWRQGDAFDPESLKDELGGAHGVVHTLGILFESSGRSYKESLRENNISGLMSSVLGSIAPRNPLREDLSMKTYESLNRDSAINVCKTYMASPLPKPATGRTFVYLSAEDIFRPFVPERYIATKRDAEMSISEMLSQRDDFRGIFIRPGLVYHAHQRPLTTPAAAALDLSSSLHGSLPKGIPTPSGMLATADRWLRDSPQVNDDTTQKSTFLRSMSNALVVRPMHVDQVGQAICEAVSQRQVRGVVGVQEMRELLGWESESKSSLERFSTK